MIFNPLGYVRIRIFLLLLMVNNTVGVHLPKPYETDKLVTKHNPSPHAFLHIASVLYILCQLDVFSLSTLHRV